MATVSSMVQPSPVRTLVRRLWGPSWQSSPTCVSPMRKVCGQITVSLPTVQSGPTQACVGSMIETPSAMRRALMRSRAMRVSWASWAREFTPRPSV